MVDPAGMWRGAGSGLDGRRLATHARLASTALLPLSAAFPATTPAGSGSAPTMVVMEAGGAAVPHAVMRNASSNRATQRTLSPYLMTAECGDDCAMAGSPDNGYPNVVPLQRVPFQCSMRAPLSPLPTAHALRADVVVTP